jgi:alpha-beta hydrolase superfamily lysophospholipase
MIVASAAAFAQADYAREKRWADEVVPGLVVGDAVYLAQKSGHKFLAIHTPAAQPRAAVIVVHGLGVHPDWALIGALRSQLAEHGYTTLSVQMPVLAATAKGAEYAPLFPEAAERLGAAAAFVREKGHRRIAIVSHSMGARMANYYLARSSGIDAWVAIGLLGPYVEPAKLSMPVLDLYGERDFPDVLKAAEARAGALARIKGAAQIQVAGADHFFAGRESELVKQVRQFLDLRLK